MEKESSRIAVITGASSGIGEASARALQKAGFHTIIGARRTDKIDAIAHSIGGRAFPLDVTDPGSVQRFAAHIKEPIHVLVNNAGGAVGLDAIDDLDEKKWLTMYETNVLGLVRMTKALLPHLRRAVGGAHVVNIGSVAALETYAGGAGYTACKHAVKAITDTMRLEWLGEPLRVTEVDPGLVETEFSWVRFAGDARRAKAVYRGMRPLTADDVAEAIRWAVSLPAHVNIDQIVIKPTDQARADKVFRRE